jgi:hypothetical protein
MIAKRFETYVALGNLGLFMGEAHCSLGKLVFPKGTIMSSRRRSLSYHGEQLKLYFP